MDNCINWELKYSFGNFFILQFQNFLFLSPKLPRPYSKVKYIKVEPLWSDSKPRLLSLPLGPAYMQLWQHPKDGCRGPQSGTSDWWQDLPEVPTSETYLGQQHVTILWKTPVTI